MEGQWDKIIENISKNPLIYDELELQEDRKGLIE